MSSDESISDKKQRAVDPVELDTTTQPKPGLASDQHIPEPPPPDILITGFPTVESTTHETTQTDALASLSQEPQDMTIDPYSNALGQDETTVASSILPSVTSSTERVLASQWTLPFLVQDQRPISDTTLRHIMRNGMNMGDLLLSQLESQG